MTPRPSIKLRAFRTDVATVLVMLAHEAGINPRDAWDMPIGEFLTALRDANARRKN